MPYLENEAIEKLFTYRRWTEEEVQTFQPLREEAKQLALKINEIVPDSPQKTRAINALHEAVYLINTAVSIYPKE
jgi:uncharacterized protein YoxC